ncbi:MAG: SPFH domain-containing protein [Butyrivibrio sp.]|jgi:membrane protease subunit (stomatin/prohibitin family)|nr:SPFH domain-containing protein [Butyrivibrio sp.]MCR4635047.1 SPFH domain-containing protein [Butyrivibrio sp.]
MGIFSKKASGGGFTDVIRCDETDYLIWKWHPQNTVRGNNTRENAIRWGSSLRIKEGSAAIFIYNSDGTKHEIIVGPYDDIIKTENFPILSSIIGFAYEGESPFQAEIYFLNMAKLIQIRFGVPYFDVFDPRFLDYGVPTAVRGTINFKVDDYNSFIELHRLENFSMQQFEDQITSAVKKHVKSIVTNIPTKNGIPVLQLERNISEVSDLIESKLKVALNEDYGVTVTKVDVSDIEIDKNSVGYKKLSSLTQNVVNTIAQGASNIVDTLSAHRVGANKIINKVKEDNGIKDTKKTSPLGSLFEKKNKKATPPPIPMLGFFVAVNGEQKGPFELDNLLEMKKEGTFSSSSLVWKEGMEEWQKAETVEELKSLFVKAPPIPSDI